MKKILFTVIFTVLVFSLSLPSFAEQDFSGYSKKASFNNGKISIISFSSRWNSTEKLKAVYDELLKNFHGSELGYLKEIYLYPDRHRQAAGEYKFRYTQDRKGNLSMSPKSYINLYDCDTHGTIKEIASTLSHEYGHHFTYYYLFQRENKLFDDGTLYQSIRGLKGHPEVNNGEHQWDMAEIAAEDYVALFGSPTGKESIVFHDVSNYWKQYPKGESISTGIYNFYPHENNEIPLPGNLPEVRQYWLDAMEYQGPALNQPPAPSYVFLEDVETFYTGALWNREDYTHYKIGWTPGKDDTTNNLEYTLVAQIDSRSYSSWPVKTVYDKDGSLSAILGYFEKDGYIYSDGILNEAHEYVRLIVYTKDGNGNVTASNVLEINLGDPHAPEAKTLRPQKKVASVRVLYDGNFIAFDDVHPQIIKGRTLVPLRKIFETLGASVSWDADTRTITAIKGSTTIILTVGHPTAYINQEPVPLDVPPQIISNRTMVPLRFISESFGSEVEWDGGAKVVLIDR